jgi:hypothetical protein
VDKPLSIEIRIDPEAAPDHLVEVLATLLLERAKRAVAERAGEKQPDRVKG